MRNREVGCEGRLWETCELMDKNCIKGRRMAMSWHNTAKSFGSLAEVNAAVVQESTVLLPGEASFECVTWLQSATKCIASRAVMLVVSSEESADGIVVVSESVSSCRPLDVSEDCGKSVRSKARTWRASVNRFSLCLQATGFGRNRHCFTQ